MLSGGKSRGYCFTQERVTLGADPGSDLFFTSPGVSQRHATLHFVDGAWTLQDLDSTNGTYLNGQLVHQAVLQDGDQIQAGGEALEVRLRPAGGRKGAPRSRSRQQPPSLAMILIAAVIVMILVVVLLPGKKAPPPAPPPEPVPVQDVKPKKYSEEELAAKIGEGVERFRRKRFGDSAASFREAQALLPEESPYLKILIRVASERQEVPNATELSWSKIKEDFDRIYDLPGIPEPVQGFVLEESRRSRQEALCQEEIVSLKMMASQERYDEVLLKFEEIRQRFPGSALLPSLEVMVKEMKTQLGERYYQRSLQHVRDNQTESDWEKCLALLDKAIQLNSKAAYLDFKKECTLNKDNREVFQRARRYYIQDKEWNRALQEYSRLDPASVYYKAAQPDVANLRDIDSLSRANQLYRAGKAEEAIEYFHRISTPEIKNNPQAQEFYKRMERAARLFAEARGYFDRKEYKKSYRALQELKAAETDAGNYYHAEARRYLDLCLERINYKVQTQLDVGLASFKAEKYQQAAASFRQARDLALSQEEVGKKILDALVGCDALYLLNAQVNKIKERTAKINDYYFFKLMMEFYVGNPQGDPRIEDKIKHYHEVIYQQLGLDAVEGMGD